MPQTNMGTERLSWVLDAIKLHDSGMTWQAVAQQMGKSHENVHRSCNRYLQSHPECRDKPVAIPMDAKALDAIRHGVTLIELATKLGMSERMAYAQIVDLTEQGHCIELRTGDVYKLANLPHAEPETIDCEWNGEKIIRFGLLGDTQINSKYTQLTPLHNAYDMFQSEGITTVYHTGDLDEGEQMRRGHQYECYNQGADEHVAEIVRVYPKRDGITTEFIIGNHDQSMITHLSFDLGKAVASERKDMIYRGQSQAFINLTPNCLLELRHPGDGTAYAQSYKIQKMVEAMSGGEKPNILAVGHYHKSEYLFYRNIHCFQTDCMQAQTPWMRGKGIAAALGSWIIEIRVGDDGQINRMKQEHFPVYRAIKDDYKNWQ